MTDRDVLRDEIERVCVIYGKTFVEKDRTINVLGGPKYIFEADGTLKSIIKAGQSFGPNGGRKIR